MSAKQKRDCELCHSGAPHDFCRVPKRVAKKRRAASGGAKWRPMPGKLFDLVKTHQDLDCVERIEFYKAVVKAHDLAPGVLLDRPRLVRALENCLSVDFSLSECFPLKHVFKRARALGMLALDCAQPRAASEAPKKTPRRADGSCDKCGDPTGPHEGACDT